MRRIEEYFKPFPILETDRTILRAICMDDLEAMYSYCSNPNVPRYSIWDAHESKEDTRKFILFVMGRYKTTGIGPWGIVHKETNTLIGSCSFVNWDNRNRNAELGYVLSEQYWNQGMMTEVIKEIVAYGFDRIGLMRIEARCMVNNIASAKVMEKVGMVKEARRRKILPLKDGWSDNYEFAILEEEYPL